MKKLCVDGNEHCYQSRYDTGFAAISSQVLEKIDNITRNMTSADARDVLLGLEEETDASTSYYVGDRCSKCGHFLQR